MSFDAAVGVYTAFDDWTLGAVWLDCWCHLPQICDWFPPNQIPLVYHTNQTASSINYNSVIVFLFRHANFSAINGSETHQSLS